VRRIAALFLTIAAGGTTSPRADGWLGIGYTFQVTNASTGRIVWLFVKQTAPSGPAERAGLKPQDVITAINGKPLWFRNDDDALSFFRGVRVGDTLVLQVKRGNTMRKVIIVAAAVPPEAVRLRKNNQAIAKARQTPK
jgi:S1-C subfamily serine protease